MQTKFEISVPNHKRKLMLKGSVKQVLGAVSCRGERARGVLVQNKQNSTGTELVRLVFYRL